MFQRQTPYRKEQDTRVNPFPLPSHKTSWTQTASNTQPTTGRTINPVSQPAAQNANTTPVTMSPPRPSLEPPQRSWNKVLTAGTQIFGTRPRANTSSSNHSRSYSAADATNGTLPCSRPPSYNNTPPSDTAATYTFSQINTSNAMLVVPRHTSGETSPIYYISVGYDPFLPTCMMTSIFRGSNDQGAYVGSFHTTLLERDNSGQAISIRGVEGKQSDVFRKGSKKKSGNNQTFEWGGKDITQTRLQWTCPDWPAPGTFTCRNSLDNRVLFDPALRTPAIVTAFHVFIRYNTPQSIEQECLIGDGVEIKMVDLGGELSTMSSWRQWLR
uniref:Uncharacterized protein n=1 Tax=Psilocybe cubensis TaxID=181762 RepID=A0A8H7XTS8_PSICU